MGGCSDVARVASRFCSGIVSYSLLLVSYYASLNMPCADDHLRSLCDYCAIAMLLLCDCYVVAMFDCCVIAMRPHGTHETALDMRCFAELPL